MLAARGPAFTARSATATRRRSWRRCWCDAARATLEDVERKLRAHRPRIGLNAHQRRALAEAVLLAWPSVEGLRIDEAMHPLTLLATGLYGEELPPQDGAPVRLVTPWKYGFKGHQVDRENYSH